MGAKTKDKNLIGLLTDTHWPELYEPEAMEWWKDWIREFRPHHVVHLGDMFNLDELSRFPKPLQLSSKLKDSVAKGREMVKDFDQFLRSFGITWELVTGNHSDRLPKYLWRRAPELAELECLRLVNVFEIPSDIVVHDPDQSIIREGVLLIHGVRYAESTTTYNLRYAMSIAQGHSHRASLKMRRLPSGRVLRSAELGCLCKFDVPYCTKGLTDWCHALGYIEGGVLDIVGKE